MRIEDFYIVAVFLKRIQDSDSPFCAVVAPSFDQLRRDLGEAMGQETIEQFGKLWSVVVRGGSALHKLVYSLTLRVLSDFAG